MSDDSRARVYLDTNVFILAFESNAENFAHLRAFFEFLRRNEKIAVTSELTLAELLAPSQQPWRNRHLFYQNLLIWSGIIELRPITRSILIETADLRRRVRLKLPDAIHVVTSLQFGRRYFLSRDRDGRRLPDEMIHVQPDAEGIRSLMETLRA